MEVKKPSVKPVPSPCFKAITLEDELRELLQGLRATAESRRQVAAIAEALRRALAVELRVVCLARPTAGTAFGVAVPEVEAVLLVDGKDLKLQKSMIRSCTDRLVSQGAFKFRRSTFRGAEPKVTLIAPEGVAFNLSVNAQTPQRSEELFKAKKRARNALKRPRNVGKTGSNSVKLMISSSKIMKNHENHDKS